MNQLHLFLENSTAFLKTNDTLERSHTILARLENLPFNIKRILLSTDFQCPRTEKLSHWFTI